jgi:hypothetical protein
MTILANEVTEDVSLVDYVAVLDTRTTPRIA